MFASGRNWTGAVWHHPFVTASDYDAAVKQGRCVLCLVSRPAGRGKAEKDYAVVPIKQTANGKYYFDIDDAVVEGWTHLPEETPREEWVM